MQFDIYSIGDSEFLEQILIALAMLSSIKDFSAMVAVGLLIGVFGTFVSAISKGGREFDIQHVLLGYIIYATMFVPTASVNIEDTFSGDVRRVDNVPIGPAAAGGIISVIGYKITQLFEVAYNPIIPRITKSEFAESLKILNSVRTKSTDSAIWKALNADAGGGATDLRKSWFNYIKDCTLKKIDLGLMTEDDLVSSQYIQAIQFNSMLFGTQIWVAPGEVAGREVTCQDGWTALNTTTNFSDETLKAYDAILGLNSGAVAAGYNSKSKTTDAIQALLAGAIDSQTYMKISVLEPILLSAADKKMSQIQDLSGSFMINQAIQQRNTSWAAEQTLFMTIVRPMLAFFEAFTYSVAPIMAFIIVLGAKGIQLAGKYFTTLLWIQLWMPILSIVNLYIYSAATSSLGSYSAMAGHNWDSFYALQTASDITQHWLATGGLLAASTPAIALMLIYGSSVTATHLAGRLKSDKFVDSGYETPNLQNTPPLATMASNYSGDSIAGMVKTGSKDMFSSATFNSALAQQTQSLDSTQNTQTEDFKSGLASSFESGTSASTLFQRASIAGQLARSSHTEIASNSLDRAKQFGQEHHLSDAHTEALAGASAIQATLGASVDVNKMAQALSGPLGISEDVLKRFLNDSSQKSSGSGPLSVKGSAAVTGSVNDTTTDQAQEQFNRKSGQNQGVSYSQAEQAAFLKDMSSALTRQNSDTFQRSWGEKDAKTLQKTAGELNATSQAYTVMKGLTSSFGNNSNLNMRTVGALVAGHDQDGYQGNSKSQDLLNQSWQMQPDSVKNDANTLFETYKRWGLPSDVADNTAKLTALTNPNNYRGNPTGLANGSALAANVIRQATGLGGGTSGDFSYNKYSNSLDEPNVIKGDVQSRASKLSMPNYAGYGSVKQNATSPTEGVFGEQLEGEQAIRSNNQLQRANVQSDASEKENKLNNANEQRARSNLLHSYDTSKAAWMKGGFDNFANWTGRRVEELGGATQAYLHESLGSMGKAYDSLKSMTPEDVSNLREKVRNNDNSLFDSLGVAGTIVKGSQSVGNTLIGAAITGVDAYNKGQDLSTAAKSMSIEERGAMYAAAISQATTVDGPQAAVQFMQKYGDDFKSTMEEIGRNKYNLTPQQAAVFAESFDTDSSAMKDKVLSLQSQYAEKDSSGKPIWDTEGNQWLMTPENRALTQAMLDRIDLSTGAGDHVGSYLAPLAGYNLVTERSIVTSDSFANPSTSRDENEKTSLSKAANPMGVSPKTMNLPPPIPSSSDMDILDKPI